MCVNRYNNTVWPFAREAAWELWTCVEAKRRAAKQNIKEAMANQDIDKLKQAIADGSAVLSDNELAQAKKLLDFLRISQGWTHIWIELSLNKPI